MGVEVHLASKAGIAVGSHVHDVGQEAGGMVAEDGRSNLQGVGASGLEQLGELRGLFGGRAQAAVS